jgi:hypothetical protein
MEITWLPLAAEADCKPVQRSAATHVGEASPIVLATMGQPLALAPEPMEGDRFEPSTAGLIGGCPDSRVPQRARRAAPPS